MEIDTFIATGGGARNDKWSQLKADILNRKVIVRNIKEAGCFGVSLLARQAETGEKPESLEFSNSDADKVFFPDEKKAAVYEEKFLSYTNLYPALKQFWQ